MGVLSALVALLLVGAIVAIVVGRRRESAPWTLATFVGLYAYLLFAVGIVMAAIGAATVVRAGLGYVEPEYSYRRSTYFPIRTNTEPKEQFVAREDERIRRERAADLLRGITLLLVGGIVSAAHAAIARTATRAAGASAAPLAHGTLLVLSALSALVGLITLAIGVYTWLQYLLIAPTENQTREPFGEPIGYAIAFTLIWLATLPSVLRIVRRRPDDPRTEPAIPPAFPTSA